MNRRVGLVAVLILVVGLWLVGPAVATATETTPRLNLTVDSTSVGEGDLYETDYDPTLTISAAVGPDAPANRTLSEVVVRVNSRLQHNVTVDDDTYDGTVTLDLEPGQNEVRVIATDTEDRANSTTFTVNKDVRAPYVQLSSPYWTPPYRPIRDGSTNGSWTMLNGTIREESAVDSLTIQHEWESADDNDNIVDYRQSYDLGTPNRNFSQRLFLGANGTNRLQVITTDEFGNKRIQRFDVTVNDTERPTLTLDSYPTRTADHELFVSGNVGDDVWVDKATVEVTYLDGDGSPTDDRTQSIFRPRQYTIRPERTDKDFNKSFTLRDPGTYRVDVEVRDILNRTVSRTFKVEKVPDGEFNIAPEIRIGRERTVVLDEETLFLDALVFDGQTERVVVATRDAETGRSIGYHRIYAGNPRDRIDFDRKVTIGPGRTEVIVRATDANRVEHEKRFFVNGTSRETFVGNETGPERSVSVRTLRGGDGGVASSVVNVTGATAGTQLSIPGDSGADAVAETPDVSFERLSVGLRRDADLRMTVTMRDRAAGDLRAPDGTTAIATLTIDHAISNDAVSGTTLRFNVRKSYLDREGVDPAAVSVRRHADGDWSRVETTRLADNSTHVRYRVESPGLSLYALVVPESVDDSTPEDPSTNETDGNGTDLPTNETDGNTTDASTNGTQDGNTTDSDSGSPQIIVTNVTLNRTNPSPGAAVAVNATLRNSGDAGGEYVAALTVLDGTNRTLVGRERVTVEAGATRNTTLVHRFENTGTYNVSVNGTRAGPVTVGGGGLLSIFSVVPVGLIGTGLAVLVALGIVGALARFVLGRVGGGEASD